MKKAVWVAAHRPFRMSGKADPATVGNELSP